MIRVRAAEADQIPIPAQMIIEAILKILQAILQIEEMVVTKTKNRKINMTKYKNKPCGGLFLYL
jgi:hypothetical protein